MAKVEIDDFHRHEVCDRCYVVMNMISDLIVDHPACDNAKDEKQLYKAISLLDKVYQRHGRKY